MAALISKARANIQGAMNSRPARESEAHSERRLPYRPALDGLRGLAVAAVLAYHAGLSWARGGFLGVDTFFVLSGYLITSLLLVEWRTAGQLNLPAFWARRARRLLPALFLMLVVVAVYAATFAKPEELDKLRGDALATLAYFANWHFVFVGTSYFDQFTLPSPLRHTWSLAIEEQFYVVWPVMVALVLWIGRGSRRVLAGCTLVLAMGSALLMAWLWEPGADPSRVYYGTDTRAQSLLVGALLGMLLVWYDPFRTIAAQRLLQLAAIICALSVAYFCIRTPDDSPFLYQGGYLLFALAAAGVIAAAVQAQPGPVTRLLSLAPFRWLGLISYGVYLYHWPVYVLLTADRTGLENPALLAARVTLTLALAVGSYYLLEMPIRRGALRWRVSWTIAPAAAAALAIVLVVVTRGGAPLFAVPDDSQLSLTAFDFGPGPPPARVMLVGDSIAQSMSIGLYPDQQPMRFVLQNVASPGCGLLPGSVSGSVNAGNCETVRDRWSPHLDLFLPEVVVVPLSPLDASDHHLDGRVLKVGTPEWEKEFLLALQDAIDILSSHGARIALLTAPYVSPLNKIDTATIDRLNTLGRQVAGANAGKVTIIDLNRYLSPDGTFTDSKDGVKVRKDGVHFSEQGADLVAGWLAPKVLQIAGQASVSVGVEPRLPGKENFLRDPDSRGVGDWQAWHSSLSTSADGLLVSSNEIAYSAYHSSVPSGLHPAAGQTYVAFAWVRRPEGAEDDDLIEIIVREDGARQDETYQIYGLTKEWQLVLVEHTVVRPKPDRLDVSILRLSTKAKAGAFVVHDAQLRLASE